jgi:hypothetical protein
MAPKEYDLDAHTIVRRAWDCLPERDRMLLEEIGAAQWQIVEEPLGLVTDRFLRSAGHPRLERQERKALDGQPECGTAS